MSQGALVSSIVEDIVTRVLRSWPPPGNHAAKDEPGRDLVFSGTLASGQPGAALLLATVADADLMARTILHDRLRWSASVVGMAGGLYGGILGTGFVGRLVAKPEEYHRLFTAIDAVASRSLPDPGRRAELAAERALKTGDYDLMTGLTGWGAYYLSVARRTGEWQPLRLVVERLVGWLSSLSIDGEPRLGWIAFNPPNLRQEMPEELASGYYSTGIAHGIAGPLTLLSLVLQEEAPIAGVEEAILILAEWLCEQRVASAAAGSWPPNVPVRQRDGEPARLGGRNGWCYGAPGIGWALLNAGIALRSGYFHQIGLDAIRATVAQALTGMPMTPCLCHGAAGLLQICNRVRTLEPGLGWVEAAQERLAGALVEQYDGDSTYGFPDPSSQSPAGADSAGLLEGSAGIALALASFAGRVHVPSWDAILLLT